MWKEHERSKRILIEDLPPETGSSNSELVLVRHLRSLLQFENKRVEELLEALIGEVDAKPWRKKLVTWGRGLEKGDKRSEILILQVSAK